MRELEWVGATDITTNSLTLHGMGTADSYPETPEPIVKSETTSSQANT